MDAIHFKKIYVMATCELDAFDFELGMIKYWKEVLVDEPNTMSVMIFRKNRHGDISVETIMRDRGGIKSHVADTTVSEEYMWNTVNLAYENGCDVYLTLHKDVADEYDVF